MRADIIVVGAGTVGSAIAYGLAARRLEVVVLDGGDGDLRAARANFGLVWVQGKGASLPPYQSLSRASADLWPEFAREVSGDSTVALEYEKRGGLSFCFGDEALELRRTMLEKLRTDCGSNDDDFEILGRAELERLLPGLAFGPDVAGASFGRHDGHVNPLRLLRALHGGLLRRGARLLRDHGVSRIRPMAPGFEVEAGGTIFHSDRIVLAAGLGTAPLAAQLSVSIPLRPQRGQIVVTERAAPFFPYPANGIRQTGDGTVMLGTSNEEVGYDTGATAAVGADIARGALRVAPTLANLHVVRQWAGLRVMTPDSYPIYMQAPDFPGAFIAVCHSGVTLAAFHATVLADAIATAALPERLSPFHPGRFDVSQAA
jgi:glycine/D-amino acid oxidase-like deaminating enzyme